MLGHVAQSVGGALPGVGGGGGEGLTEVFNSFAAGSYEFVAPTTGPYLFFGTGAGGSGGSGATATTRGGGGGGHGQTLRNLVVGQVILIEIGVGGTGAASGQSGNAGADTTITIGSTVMRARGGGGGISGVNSGAAGGSASGFDLNFTGQDGRVGPPGAGLPKRGPNSTTWAFNNTAPGAASDASSSATTTTRKANDGEVLIYRIG